jgi:hypothetical protein
MCTKDDNQLHMGMIPMMGAPATFHQGLFQYQLGDWHMSPFHHERNVLKQINNSLSVSVILDHYSSWLVSIRYPNVSLYYFVLKWCEGNQLVSPDENVSEVTEKIRLSKQHWNKSLFI